MTESRIIITSTIRPEKFNCPAAYTTASSVDDNIFTKYKKFYTCGISLVITQALSRSFPACDFILMSPDDKFDIKNDKVFLALFEQTPIISPSFKRCTIPNISDSYKLRLAPNHWNTYSTYIRLYSIHFLPCKEEVDVH